MKEYIFNKDIVIFQTANLLDAEGIMIEGGIPLDWQNSRDEFLVDELRLSGKEMPLNVFETKLSLLAGVGKQRVFIVNSMDISKAYVILALCGYIQDIPLNYMIALILSGYTYKITPRLREIPLNVIKEFKHYSKNNTLVGSLDALNMLICNAKNEAIAKNEIRLM